MDYNTILTKHINLLYASIDDILRNGYRSFIVILCLISILFPFITALAISEGLKYQAKESVKQGADFYVSSNLLGANGPININYFKNKNIFINNFQVIPRVIGRTFLLDQMITIAGIDKEALLNLKPLIKGRVPLKQGEVLISNNISNKFGIKSGIRFTVAANKKKVFMVVGLFHPYCLWAEKLMIMHINDANEFFKINNNASQLLLYKKSQSQQQNSFILNGIDGLWIEDRIHLNEIFEMGYNNKGGVFVVLIIISIVLSIPAFWIASNFSSRQYNNELAIMKATGWTKWEIIKKIILEFIIIDLIAVCLSILISMFWIKCLQGIFIAQFFVAELNLIPEAHIPSRYLMFHLILGLSYCLLLTLSGSMLNVWTNFSQMPCKYMR